MPRERSLRRRRRTSHRTFFVLALAVASAAGCSQEFDVEAHACARFVRFHLGLHHPVELTDAERSADKPNVRVRFRGTRAEATSAGGVAICRFSAQGGELRVVGASIDDATVDPGAIRAYHRFNLARKREAGG